MRWPLSLIETCGPHFGRESPNLRAGHWDYWLSWPGLLLSGWQNCWAP